MSFMKGVAFTRKNLRSTPSVTEVKQEGKDGFRGGKDLFHSFMVFYSSLELFWILRLLAYVSSSVCYQ
jgi:hypothetical protein